VFEVGVCDPVRQGPTLVIVRSTTGHTFGGHAVAPWASSGGHIRTAGCFLFLIENPHNDAPSCFELKDGASSTYCVANDGPTFGSGCDMRIHGGGDPGRSYTNFPHAYTDTLGRGNATFTGTHDFTPEDYEVWGVT
jgi:hypothetical protein